MVDTIIFHHPMEADRALWLMRSLDDREAVTLPIEPGAAPLQFGDHVLVVGVWGGPTGMGDPKAQLEELLRLLSSAKRHGVLMCWRDQAACAYAGRFGVASIAATGDRDEDLRLLRSFAAAVQLGPRVRAPAAAAAVAAASAGAARAAPAPRVVASGAPSGGVTTLPRPPRTGPANDSDLTEHPPEAVPPRRPRPATKVKTVKTGVPWAGVATILMIGAAAGGYFALMPHTSKAPVAQEAPVTTALRGPAPAPAEAPIVVEPAGAVAPPEAAPQVEPLSANASAPPPAAAAPPPVSASGALDITAPKTIKAGPLSATAPAKAIVTTPPPAKPVKAVPLSSAAPAKAIVSAAPPAKPVKAGPLSAAPAKAIVSATPAKPAPPPKALVSAAPPKPSNDDLVATGPVKTVKPKTETVVAAKPKSAAKPAAKPKSAAPPAPKKSTGPDL